MRDSGLGKAGGRRCRHHFGKPDASAFPNPQSRIPNPGHQPMTLPRHLAVIMDGNGRWAARRRRPRMIGHRADARTVTLSIYFFLESGISALTLFAFSSANSGRPAEGVGTLMKPFPPASAPEVVALHRGGVR